jgi:6-phosphogluconolactonase
MIRVFNDFESLSRAVAELFVEKCAEAIAARGRFGVALAGGSTPRRAYEILASEGFRDRVDWSKVHVFWGDERFVSPNDPHSNQQMARDSLLDKVPIPKDQIHPMVRELGDLTAAAEEYSVVLENFCHGQQPTLDLAMLGVGPDGHTASLFPGSILSTDTQQIAVPVRSSMQIRDRISLTVPVLARSRTVVFIVVGIEKSHTLARLFLEEEGQLRLPAAVVAGQARNPIWFVDHAAASQLPPEVATNEA